ncbi:alpha/beta hydrolase fold domain-containing protein [Agromyces sp. MMS17-SY077]|uniref:Alpha/beta hydrolase fold domain-containing protein n=2 Tax=Agromyces seonyuensis TaxID=2662446 RepID=A0A6I4P1Q4_9MICO|nr:alpha/beta hydrolase [Agromyces seonyuensis]MWB97959.1 alpha/beta hydrolase fold domain-containing protein [Agromyces seonyuensis]
MHGGGWQWGDRRGFGAPPEDGFARIAAAGFAVASVDYRLSGEARFPAQLDDVSAAIDRLRADADVHSLDPDRIVLWGESAGGTISALLGLGAGIRERGVVGVVDWYGPHDLEALTRARGIFDDPESAEARWIGGAVSAMPEAARAASPVDHVHPDAPPFHLAAGDRDVPVPLAQSESFAEALRRAGVDVEFDVHPGAGHRWREAGPEVAELALARALAFASRVTARTPVP